MASESSTGNLHLEGPTQTYSSQIDKDSTAIDLNSKFERQVIDQQDYRVQNKVLSLTREKKVLIHNVVPSKNSHTPDILRIPGSDKGKYKALSPINVDSGLYKDHYYTVLEEGGSFKRKGGLFSDYSVKNKVTIEQIKHDRSPKQDHNRYMSKPVLFTALDTKNKLSESVTVTHSQLLASRPKQLLTVPEPTNQIGVANKKLSDINLTTPRSNHSSKPSVNLPQIHSAKNSKNNTILSSYELRGSAQSLSPAKSHDVSIRTPTLALNGPDFNMDLNESKMLSSLTGKSISKYFGENILDSIKRSTSEKLPSEVSKIEEKQIPRYKTKKLTDNIFKAFYERSKLEGDKYLEHSTDSVYKINSSIALAKLENEKSLVRKNPLNPIAYTPKTGKIIYKEPTTVEQLNKFDENIIGWAKSIPNFGKQRWTYDPDWKFGLI